MFDHLVEANKLEQVMAEHGLKLPEDLDFIKEQIAGPLKNGESKVPVAVHVEDRGYFYLMSPALSLSMRWAIKWKLSERHDFKQDE